MMQAGFTPNAAHLGTSLDQTTPGSASISTTAAQLYSITSPQPDIAMNERLSQFKRTAPALQGMTLTHVPTGGFPASQPSIIVGAGPGGVEYNTRLPPLFTLPVNDNKRVTVMPDAPLTSGAPGSELVFRQPDGKTRNVHGAATIARVDKEARAAARKRKRYMNDLLAGAGIRMGASGGSGSGSGGAAQDAQFQAPQLAQAAPPEPAPEPEPAPAPNPSRRRSVRQQVAAAAAAAAAAAPSTPSVSLAQRQMYFVLVFALVVALLIIIALAIVIGVSMRK
jgi:hypothetical protein